MSADGKKLPTVLECHGSVDARLSFRVAGVRGEALKKLQSKKQQKQNTKSSRYAWINIPMCFLSIALLRPLLIPIQPNDAYVISGRKGFKCTRRTQIR